jgi:glutamate/tyrosine decarboxylase-like PLP-dependent enzyme
VDSAQRSDSGGRSVPGEIAIVCSEDTHYSVDKAANLLGIDRVSVPVGEHNRQMELRALRQLLGGAQAHGKRGFLCVLNMGTTMFGSVDNIAAFTELLDGMECPIGFTSMLRSADSSIRSRSRSTGSTSEILAWTR